MTRAIIFDCFGVLTTDGWLPFKQKHFGHDKSLMEQASDLNKQVDAGLADYDDFIFSMAQMANLSPREARSQIEDNVANDELFDYIRDELKPHYKLGLLSNAGANWLSDLFSPEQAGQFDQVCLSCDSGFVKPDERAYNGVASKLGVQPEECIFIDDQPRFCTAAREAGMQAIHYRDFQQCRAELDALLGRPTLGDTNAA